MPRQKHEDEIQVETIFHKVRVGKHIALVEGPAPSKPERPKGRLPRITRYMALAIYYEDLIRQGQVHDYAEIAMLGYVTRARVTQIMNLRLLAPEIQERILNLVRLEGGREGCNLHQLQAVAWNRVGRYRRRKKKL